MTPSNDPMDWEQAVGEFDGDAEFLKQLVGEFLAVAAGQVMEMRRALEERDCERIWREAHSIKGGAANLTAAPLSEVAYALEKAGRARDLSHAGELIDALEAGLDKLRHYLSHVSGAD